MATPFELLEAFVTISERGAKQVEAALKRIETLAAKVSSTPVNVSVSGASAAASAAAAATVSTALAAAAVAAQNIEAEVASVGTSLMSIAVPATNAFRGALVPLKSQLSDVSATIETVKVTANEIPKIGTALQLVATRASEADKFLVSFANTAKTLEGRSIAPIASNLGSLAPSLNGAITAAGAFDSTLSSIVTRALAVGAAIAGVKLVVDGLFVNAEKQKSFVSFEAILKDGEAAKKLLIDIGEVTQNTPFPVEDIRRTVQQLLALGSSADTVISEFLMIATVAAGVGTPIEQIARAYTQVRSKQQLYAEELQQLGDAGVPILLEIAEMTGQTTAKVRELASAGQLGFPELEAAFRRMTSEGGRFNGILEKTAFLGQGGINQVKNQFKELTSELATASGVDLAGVFQATVIAINAGTETLRLWNAIVGEISTKLESVNVKLTDGLIVPVIAEAWNFLREIDDLGYKFANAVEDPLERARLRAEQAAPEIAALTQRWTAMGGAIQKAGITLKEFNSGTSPIDELLKQLADPNIELAESLRKSLLNPVDELQEKLTEVRFLFAKGLITEDTFTRAIEKAVKDTDKLLEKSQEFRRSLVTTGFNVGSTQAFTFRLESDLPREQIRKSEEQLQAQKIGNDFLKEIAEKIDEIKINPDPTPELFESELF